jgi:hypothetical protein
MLFLVIDEHHEGAIGGIEGVHAADVNQAAGAGTVT